eukprot:jgi/Psemu1/285188/fgenesh1_pg.76_\
MSSGISTRFERNGQQQQHLSWAHLLALATTILSLGMSEAFVAVNSPARSVVRCVCAGPNSNANANANSKSNPRALSGLFDGGSSACSTMLYSSKQDDDDDDDDDGWGTATTSTDDDVTSTASTDRKLNELRYLQEQASNKAQQQQQQQQNRVINSVTEEPERDMFIPIMAVVSLAGLFGAYGYETLRLASRGELYLPF